MIELSLCGVVLNLCISFLDYGTWAECMTKGQLLEADLNVQAICCSKIECKDIGNEDFQESD